MFHVSLEHPTIEMMLFIWAEVQTHCLSSPYKPNLSRALSLWSCVLVQQDGEVQWNRPWGNRVGAVCPSWWVGKLCAHPRGLGSSVLCVHVCVWPPGQTLELRKGDSARKCWSNWNATLCTDWGRLFSAATRLWPLLNCPAFHQSVMLVKYSS